MAVVETTRNRRSSGNVGSDFLFLCGSRLESVTEKGSARVEGKNGGEGTVFQRQLQRYVRFKTASKDRGGAVWESWRKFSIL